MADPSAPGWTLRRRGSGFSLLDETGAPLDCVTARERVDQLVIPPAWKNLWIAPYPNAHIQAIGTDAGGRRQYIYHEQWNRRRARQKYGRALDLAERLPAARRLVTRDLRTRAGTRERALAAAFRLLDSAYLRVGSERYAQQHGSRGLTTLEGADARVSENTVFLNFVGKSAVDWSSQTTDEDLAAVIRSLKRRGPHATLLAWKDEGDWRAVRAGDVNEYVRLRTRGEFTAKDFRTLHGSIIAATELATHGPAKDASEMKGAITEAVNQTAAVLGNTPAIARNSYIDPRVFDRFRDGHCLETGTIAPETAIRRLILGSDE
ncbi:DNA topoisomerase IB [Homoserinimonas sp. OAct 916]|uniref:DNA topoisomerase IB n=1 Tax=Homoserinimonas sp. OAct 916 TaxID=2211450 RepID=UPI001E514BAE|nr:DNA topoisomerase IB [Homoserinimonas sp. OAct 916]